MKFLQIINQALLIRYEYVQQQQQKRHQWCKDTMMNEAVNSGKTGRGQHDKEELRQTIEVSYVIN